MTEAGVTRALDRSDVYRFLAEAFAAPVPGLVRALNDRREELGAALARLAFDEAAGGGRGAARRGRGTR